MRLKRAKGKLVDHRVGYRGRTYDSRAQNRIRSEE